MSDVELNVNVMTYLTFLQPCNEK